MLDVDTLPKRYVYKVAASLVSAVINFAILLLVPKALGPVYYGIFIYLQQFFTQLVAVLDLGVSSAFFSKISAKNNRKELIKFFFLFFCLMLFFIIVAALSFQYFELNQIDEKIIEDEYIYLAAILSIAIYLMSNITNLFDGYGRSISLEKYRIISKILSFLMLIYFVYSLDFNLSLFYLFNISVILIFLFISYFSFSADSRLEFFKSITHSCINWKEILREVYLFSSPLFIHTLIISASTIFDIWLLKELHGGAEVGYYGMALAISQIPIMFISPLVPLIVRECSILNGSNNIKEMQIIYNKYIIGAYIFIAFVSFNVFFQAENILMFFGNEYSDSFHALLLFALFPITQTIHQLSGSVFIATEQTKNIRDTSIFVSVVGIILSVLFMYILDLGAVGLGGKMLIVGFITLNIQTYYIGRIIKISYKSLLLKLIQPLLILLVIVWVTHFYMSDISTSVIINIFIPGFISMLFVIISFIAYPKLYGVTIVSRQKIIPIILKYFNINN